MMETGLGLAMLIAVAAGLMRGFAGVGSGMLMAPFFVHIFGPVATVGIVILLDGAATAQLLPSVRERIQWRVVLPMAAVAALFMPMGSWLLVSLDIATVQFAVALTVTVSSLVLLTGWRYHGRKPLSATMGVGAVSGVLIALTSAGNPPVMLYLLSGRDEAATNRANFTGYFAVTLATLLLMMTVRGMIAWQTVMTAAMLLPGFLGGTWVGSRLFRKSNEALYRRIALGVLFVAGLYGIARHWLP